MAAAAGKPSLPLSFSFTGSNPLLSPRRGTKFDTLRALSSSRLTSSVPMSSLTLQNSVKYTHAGKAFIICSKRLGAGVSCGLGVTAQHHSVLQLPGAPVSLVPVSPSLELLKYARTCEQHCWCLHL